MGNVLLIIIFVIRNCLTELSRSKVHFTGKKHTFAGRAGQHVLKLSNSDNLLVCYIFAKNKTSSVLGSPVLGSPVGIPLTEGCCVPATAFSPSAQPYKSKTKQMFWTWHMWPAIQQRKKSGVILVRP